MKTPFLIAAIFGCVGISAIAATSLTESTFTEIIREANVVAAADKSVAPAKTNEVFRVPDLVRTGSASRLEMTAPDQTITRVGANTVFTFAPEGRDIVLERGSILFHPPEGGGGGAIKNKGTAAAVLGTTEIGAIMADGGFKILDLEGTVKVTLKNGLYLELKAGEMVIVSPDGTEFGPLLIVNLGQLLPHLLLVTGFSEPLSSLPLIEAAIAEQNRKIADGTLKNLVSLQTAYFGLDIIYRGSNGLPTRGMDAPDLTREPASPTK